MVGNKKAGLIGTNWGRMYPWVFRRLGYEVDMIMGLDKAKTAAVAGAEGVRHSTADPRDLLDMDIIVLASPAETHAHYLDLFNGRFIFCEKPLYGTEIPGTLQDDTGRVWVNYAFPSLGSAAVLADLIRSRGVETIKNIRLEVGCRLDGNKTQKEWFHEVAVHEIYFLQTIFGCFRVKRLEESGSYIHAYLDNAQGQVLEIVFSLSSQKGIDVSISAEADDYSCSLRGGFQPGRFWNFDPVACNGRNVNKGEYSCADKDIWVEANVKNTGHFLGVVTGVLDSISAVEKGLCSYSQGLSLDLGLVMNKGV